MQELVFLAINPEGQRHEWPLGNDEVRVGRADGTTMQNRLAVEGDARLSRWHFNLKRQGDQVLVRRADSARNPLVFEGQEQDEFTLKAGQVFFAGKSQFGVVRRQPTSEFTLLRQAKENARLRRMEDCFEGVLELLKRLREQASQGSPWRQAFPVIRRLLPDVEHLAFMELHGSRHRILDQEGSGPDLDPQLLERAQESRTTVTFLWQAEAVGAGTLCARSNWAIASPIRGLENTQYALCASGSNYLDGMGLEDVAAIVDVMAELVGHHMIIEQASEYSSLLGVFGHHVGTLFKTSGALELWSDPKRDPDVGRVLDRLLPIWGVSQAIALHKKQGEQDWQNLLAGWVDPRWTEPDQEICQALADMVRYLYGSNPEASFLPWFLEGQLIPFQATALRTLPPLADNPILMDKTLAITIGLVEMLNNLRKYPEARGAGREDRRELMELAEEERRVQFRIWNESGVALLEFVQPVVTAGDGSIPRSRSLERIRALESRLLHGLVETGEAEWAAATSLPHIVKIRQRWSYRWRQLLPS